MPLEEDHDEFFNEHDEEDQYLLYQRAKDIAEENSFDEIFCEEEDNEYYDD